MASDEEFEKLVNVGESFITEDARAMPRAEAAAKTGLWSATRAAAKAVKTGIDNRFDKVAMKLFPVETTPQEFKQFMINSAETNKRAKAVNYIKAIQEPQIQYLMKKYYGKLSVVEVILSRILTNKIDNGENPHVTFLNTLIIDEMRKDQMADADAEELFTKLKRQMPTTASPSPLSTFSDGGRKRRGKKSRKSRKGRKGRKSRKNKRRTKRR